MFRSGLTLVGVRQVPPGADAYDDLLGYAWLDREGLTMKLFPGTTSPGGTSLVGRAVVEPGAYRRAFEVGLHKGKPAFVNYGHTPLAFRRDGGRLVTDEYRGLNLHRGGIGPKVGGYSEGCQVLKGRTTIQYMLDMARSSEQDYFDYILLEP
jgi:hypothetical protein